MWGHGQTAVALSTTALTLENFGGRAPLIFNPKPKASWAREEGPWKQGNPDDLWHEKRTEWGQQQPATELGGGAVALQPFARTNNDMAPTSGMEKDGWRPLYNERWWHQMQAQQLFERRTVGEFGEVDRLLKNNQGVTYKAPGTLNVTPIVQPGCFERKPWA